MLTLENLTRSEIPYALLTTHSSAKAQINNNIVSGDLRYLNLRQAPFCLPELIELLRDSGAKEGVERFVGLWEREQIADSGYSTALVKLTTFLRIFDQLGLFGFKCF